MSGMVRRALEIQETTLTEERQNLLEATITLTGRPADGSGTIIAAGSAKLLEAFRRNATSRGKTACRSASNIVDRVQTSTGEISTDASGAGPVDVGISRNGDEYSLSFELPRLQGVERTTVADRITGCDPPAQITHSQSRDYDGAEPDVSIDQIPVDPRNPHTLSGSRKYERDGSTITVQWNLVRCG